MAKRFADFKSVYDGIEMQGIDVETGVSGAATKLTVTINSITGGEITVYGVDALCDGAGSSLITLLDSTTTIGYAMAAPANRLGQPFAPPKGIRVVNGKLVVVAKKPAAGSVYLAVYYYNAIRPSQLRG